MKGYIARNKDGLLHFFSHKPTRFHQEDYHCWVTYNGIEMFIPSLVQDELKRRFKLPRWEDEPIEVELKIELV